MSANFGIGTLVEIEGLRVVFHGDRRGPPARHVDSMWGDCWTSGMSGPFVPLGSDAEVITGIFISVASFPSITTSPALMQPAFDLFESAV